MQVLKPWGLNVAAWGSCTKAKQDRTGGQTVRPSNCRSPNRLSTRTESYPPPYLRFTLYDSERGDAGPCRNKVVNLNDTSALSGCLVFWTFQYQTRPYQLSAQSAMQHEVHLGRDEDHTVISMEGRSRRSDQGPVVSQKGMRESD